MGKNAGPPESFTSAGGRRFTIGEREDGVSRGEGVRLWPILLDGERAGTLYQNDNYGRTAAGELRWQASTRQLYWKRAGDAPLGVGFDVAPFDTAAECLVAWGRSADEILDWSEGKRVRSIYSKTGYYQKGEG